MSLIVYDHMSLRKNSFISFRAYMRTSSSVGEVTIFQLLDYTTLTEDGSGFRFLDLIVIEGAFYLIRSTFQCLVQHKNSNLVQSSEAGTLYHIHPTLQRLL